MMHFIMGQDKFIEALNVSACVRAVFFFFFITRARVCVGVGGGGRERERNV